MVVKIDLNLLKNEILIKDQFFFPLCAEYRMTWMLRDGSAMVGRIVFAGVYGTRLDCNSKSWRLFADILNDMAICVEIAAPLTPFFVELACMGSLGKAIVSVAGGATRAALTQVLYCIVSCVNTAYFTFGFFHDSLCVDFPYIIG